MSSREVPSPAARWTDPRRALLHLCSVHTAAPLFPTAATAICAVALTAWHSISPRSAPRPSGTGTRPAAVLMGGGAPTAAEEPGPSGPGPLPRPAGGVPGPLRNGPGGTTGRATRRGVFHLRIFRRIEQFRLGWKLLSVARCPILLHPRLRLNEMSRSLFQKDSRIGFQMLRFRSFERQRSLLVTEQIQMDFVCILTSVRRERSAF